MTDLKKAQADLKALQDDLPNFHALLTDNEQDAQRLKTERAGLDEQAQARGRVGVAREMLEQHQSDIATARAEVSRLEASERLELLFVEAVGHAEAEKQHKAAFDNLFAKLNKGLESGLQKLIAEFDTLTEHRQAFSTITQDVTVSAELAARGVSSPKEFAPSLSEPYGGTIWNLFNNELYDRGQERFYAEQKRKAAARAAQQPKPAPALREIEVSAVNATLAHRCLGNLAKQVVRRNSSQLNGKTEFYTLCVEPEKLDEAVARLQRSLGSDFTVKPSA